MSAELFQKGFSRFDTDINRIQAEFFDLVHIGDLDTWDVFHAQNLSTGIFGIRLWHPNMLEFGCFKVFAE